ncbi:hypothetical protein BUALT_Bualt06G0052100 [Buddleja alternifolia]|uniref:Uncharacterized protein n=1 Tax=Buddleja alternifolia TaxID=168488 RepID=A0AAV6XNQ4_9LAMI|nr:hypothetical protein BUALT_Bualt06G0052100 [Buddleja alternifolia]
MSAYGHEMEREYSAQSLSTRGGSSLSTRGGSEMGSRYTTDAGVYMSPFAATIFISGLVTVGMSLLSLILGLSVMLSSCQSRNSGVVELYRNTQNYDYCMNLALHAELNGLGSDSFPAICKDINRRYVKEGQYRKDLNITVGIVEDFFSSFRPRNDGRDVVLMDADDFFGSKTLHIYQFINRVDEDTNYLKHIFVMNLYKKLKSDRWPLILLSRKPEKLRNTTVDYLISVGCRDWSSLIMRMDNEMQMDFQEFLSRQRSILQREGFRIIAVISSQMDALSDPRLGDRFFKLPNPIFRYSAADHDENRILEE